MRLSLFCFLILCSVSISATTDSYERTITEVVLGKNDHGLVIFQEIRDTKVGNVDYIVIKDIQNKQLITKEIMTVNTAADIRKITQTEDFSLVVPKLYQEEYLQLFGGNTNIYFMGLTFSISSVLPKELWSFQVDRIENVIEYKGCDLVVLLLVSKSGYEKIRKVLLLKNPKEDN